MTSDIKSQQSAPASSSTLNLDTDSESSKVEDRQPADDNQIAADSAETGDPAQPLLPPARPAEEILQEAKNLVGTWKKEEGERLRELSSEFRMAYPDRKDEFGVLINRHQEAVKLLTWAFKLGSGSPKPPPLESIKADALKLNIPGLEKRLVDQFKCGERAKARSRKENRKKANGGPLSNVKPRPHQAKPVVLPKNTRHERTFPPPPSGLHPNDLRALVPAKEWSLLLDETGSDFLGNEAPSRQGKFVGLLVNDHGSGLPALPKNWHAVDCDDIEQIDTVFQAVLDAPCGVIGLTLNALPTTFGERWLDGMLAIVDWVLRILPLDGPTRINVAIEGRPPFRPEVQARVAARDALARLARVWPERAGIIDLRIQTIAKDGHQLNGYVDALAFTWGSKTKSAKERLKRSGLAQTCLLSADARSMTAFWDAWDQPGGLPADQWAELVSGPDARRPESIVSTLLAALAEACKQSPERVQPYLDEFRRHLGSKALDLRRLASQVEWLRPILEHSQSLTPIMRLIWLTARLAQANHMGDLEKKWNRDLHELAERLRDEDARLVCHAHLHLAVNDTNRFDFAAAEEILTPWRDCDPAIPGLRLWGQALSSLGQAAAFTGRHAQAGEFFSRAIQAFRRLSDPQESSADCAQTLCYQAVNAMDDPSMDAVDVRACLSEYLQEMRLPPDPAQAAETLASDATPALKYAHHTLLRWLVYRGDEAAWGSYYAQRQEWEVEEGHPWPLIQLYRALLLHHSDPEAALNLALDASSIAFSAGQGPTVQCIGACCRAVAQHWGAPWPEANLMTQALHKALPMAEDRIAILENWISNPDTSPQSMLAAVLPFNFR